MMNQNLYPAHSEEVLAALPIQATRVLMDGNHTTFFNPIGIDAVRAISLRSRRVMVLGWRPWH